MDVSISDAVKFFKDKLITNPQLKEQMSKNAQSIQIQLQVAKFSKLSESYKKRGCIKAITNDTDDHQIYFIYGNVMPDLKDKDFECFKNEFIQLTYARIDKFYSLVFFNTNQMTGSVLNDFKEFYTMLPSDYFTQMQDFLVVHPNFFIKQGGMFQNSDIQKFFKKMTRYIENLKELSKEKWFKYSMVKIFSQDIKNYDQSYKDIEQARIKTVIKRQQSKLPVGDDDLDDDPDDFDKDKTIFGLELRQYEMNDQQIPIYLDLMVAYFENKQDKLIVEGIFRKQAAMFEEKLLAAAIAAKKITYLAKVEDPHIVACVFKQFFLKLAQPIIPYETYEYVIQKQISKEIDFEHDQELGVKIILAQLPALNFSVLGFTIGFLKHVTTFKDHNLMTSYNMAVVFGPSFFRSEVVSMKDMQFVKLFVALVQKMIERFEYFFQGVDYKNMIDKQQEVFMQSLYGFDGTDVGNMEDIDNIVEQFQQ